MRGQLAALAVLTLVLGAGCEARVEFQQAVAAPNPMIDYVRVGDTPPRHGIYKFCDGPHLLYVYDEPRAGGITAVPNGCAK